MRTPYRELLQQCGHAMEESREADIPALWKAACGEWKEQLVLPGEAYQILWRMGEVFTYTSLDSSLQLLQSGRRRLETLMAKEQADFAGKRKLYSPSCSAL